MIDRFLLARHRARKAAIYFSHILRKLGYCVSEMVTTSGTPTLGVTDEGALFAHPKALEDIEKVGGGLPAIAFILLHEVCHVLFNHPKRRKKLMEKERGAFDQEVSATAMDLSINWILRELAKRCAQDSDLKDPSRVPWIVEPIGPYKGCFPSDFELKDGLEYETYYELLKQKKEAGEKMPEPHPGAGSDGEIDGGKMDNLPQLKELIGSQGFEAQTEKDQEDIRKQVERDMREMKPGAVPKGLLQGTQTALVPEPVDWQAHFRCAISVNVDHRRGAMEYLFGTPNRRQAALGYGPLSPILPGLREFVPKIALVDDTSGSVVGDSTLHRKLIAYTKDICESMGCEVFLIHVDTKVHAVEKVSARSEIRTRGGGGTFLVPGIQKALELEADIIGVLTDGEIGPNGLGQDPNVPVVVVLLKDYKHDVQYAESQGWAAIIVIPEGGLK